MKVALYFSGHMRTYEQTWNNWKKYVVDPFQADVFISTWPYHGRFIDRNFAKKTGHQDLGTVNVDTPIDVDRINDLIKPKKFSIMDQSQFDKETDGLIERVCNWRDSCPEEFWVYFPKGNLSQYYGWNAVNNLRKEYENETGIKYDVIIRSRSDLLIENYINPNYLNINQALLTCIRNDINYPIYLYDYIYSGSPAHINAICNIYNAYEPIFEYCQKNNKPEDFFSSHTFIAFYLLSIKCPWLEVDFPIKRFNHCLVR